MIATPNHTRHEKQSFLEQFEGCQARNRDLVARNRDLEAKLQAQCQVAEQAQRLARQAAQHAEQMERQVASLQRELAEDKEEARRRDDETGGGAMESSREELQSLRRRMRYYEHDEGEELLLFVTRRLMDTWDAKTQRRVLLVTKATYAELLPRVTRAVLTRTRPCSFAGANGLRELTLELAKTPVPAHVRSDIAKWSHLTGLRVLTLSGKNVGVGLRFQLPSSISNLAGLSELHIKQVGLMGLRHLSVLTQLASLHATDGGWLKFGGLPGLPSLQVLHVDGSFVTGMQCVARQPNLTELHVYGDVDADGDPMDHFELLAVLTRLQELVLRQCLGPTSLEPLAALTALTYLDLEGTGATSLQPLTTLAQLRALNLSKARHLQSLGPLAHLSALEHLHLRCCGHDEEPDLGALNVAPLTALTSLKTINIADAVLRNVELLAGMQQLTVRGRAQQ